MSFPKCRWYATIADIRPGLVELPLRVTQDDGGVLETLHIVDVTWPWDILSWLYNTDKLFKWGSNRENVQQVHADHLIYWEMLSEEESIKQLNLEDPARTFPLFWHADGVRIYKQQKCWIYSYSSAMKKGPSLSSKLLFVLVRENMIWKPHTHDRIADVIGWVQTVLQTGRFPECDFNGSKWPSNSKEAEKAGDWFAGGYRFAFSAFKGDWEARVTVHKLQRSYNHNNVCEHCAATKVQNEFNYRNFSPRAPYLDVTFTHNDYLLMTPDHLQSHWINVPGWTKDRNLEEPFIITICWF